MGRQHDRQIKSIHGFNSRPTVSNYWGRPGSHRARPVERKSPEASMIEFTKDQLIYLIQVVDSELTKLKSKQYEGILTPFELRTKEMLHSIDAKLDEEHTLLNFKDRKMRDL